MMMVKVDYKMTIKTSLFTLYLYAHLVNPSDYDTGNLLTTNFDSTRRAQSAIFGDTYLIGAGTVSSFRATAVRTLFERANNTFFTLNDLGVKNVYFPADWAKMAIVTLAGTFKFGGVGNPTFTNS